MANMALCKRNTYWRHGENATRDPLYAIQSSTKSHTGNVEASILSCAKDGILLFELDQLDKKSLSHVAPILSTIDGEDINVQFEDSTQALSLVCCCWSTYTKIDDPPRYNESNLPDDGNIGGPGKGVSMIGAFDIVISQNEMDGASDTSHAVSSHTLRRCMGVPSDLVGETLSSVDFSTYAYHASRIQVRMSFECEQLLKSYFQTMRKKGSGLDTNEMSSISVMSTLLKLAICNAKLCFRSIATRDDALISVMLVEETMAARFGTSCLGFVPLPDGKDNVIYLYDQHHFHRQTVGQDSLNAHVLEYSEYEIELETDAPTVAEACVPVTLEERRDSVASSINGHATKEGTMNRSIVAYAMSEHGDNKEAVRGSATVGVPTAVARSMLVQALQFWYRVPIKFFRATSIGMLTHTIRTQGAGFVYRQVLPPLFMNTFIGSVLYTTYIFTLPIFHPAFTYQKSRTFPPPPFPAVFMAGAIAGAAQSLVAAPMDSVKVKFQIQDVATGGKHKSIAGFAISTLKELGLRAVYRGYTLILVKDALACGLFFGVFEWVKQQGYYYFMDELYGIRDELESLKAQEISDSSRSISALESAPSLSPDSPRPRPYFFLEPTFVLLAGAAAAVAYQAVDYPLEQIRSIFLAKEAELMAEKSRNPQQPHSQRLNASSMRSGSAISSQLYEMTWNECKANASSSGGWRRFLFSNFATTAIRAVPAASIGFLVFEVMKRKLDARMYESEDREIAWFLDQMMKEREAERMAELKAAEGLVEREIPAFA
ncbi:hypothetical protein BGX20_011453 [Mortierella sp. AD010]|nr:hypothetical protein BGX20_011453 [Mortierella sp. AD010]